MATKTRITLVLGGARSGKSAHAMQLISALQPPWVYCATAQARDQEMKERILRHKSERGIDWITVEEPFAIHSLLVRETRPVLVDCLTLWLSNIMLEQRNVPVETEKLLQALRSSQCPCVLVSNEVGLSIVPDNALARAFRDHAGRLNQRIALIADRVTFMVAGIPMVLKDE